MVNGHYSRGLHGMQAQIDQLTQQQIDLQKQYATVSQPFEMNKLWLGAGLVLLVGLVAMKR